MKTELDFTKVPLDKWVDLFNAVLEDGEKLINASLKDVKKAAEVQVKDEADLNKEIAEAYTAWISSPKSEPELFSKLTDAVAARKELLGIKDEPVEQKPKLLPVEEVIK